jgi:hypothetical protein
MSLFNQMPQQPVKKITHPLEGLDNIPACNIQVFFSDLDEENLR